MSTDLALRNPAQSGVLSRIGTPDERQYLIRIMAEQIGIPSSEADRTDVIALLATAAQQTLLYGWVPGIHLHVQKFETDRSKKAREKNPNARPIYSYTLVVGEKAWKDSGTHWRERGVNWRYQRRPMTLAEVKEEARLQGFNEALASNAYGMWSRIIIAGEDDPKDDHNPLWSAGIYTGKIKAGNYWRNDVIPTGASSRDVSIRRADKRAMMQSTLTLLPIDNLSADQRILKLVDTLRSEADNKERISRPMQRQEAVETEADGDMLWAKTGARPASSGARHEEEDFSMGEELHHAQPSEDDDAPLEADARIVNEEEPSARPTSPGARPLNQTDGPCPECHAPTGKAHATTCAIANESSAARPEEPSARPEAVDPGARPVETKAKEEATFSNNIFAEIAHMNTAWLARGETSELIRRVRNSDHDSAMKMSDKYLSALVTVLRTDLPTIDEEEAYWVLTALVGYQVSPKHKPGQFVHSYLIKLLRNSDEKAMAALREVLEACRNIAIATVEGTDHNG